jgi:3-deoxy-manno-octulosonate cytidylyltransferase (CMP-KDO synthetase)
MACSPHYHFNVVIPARYQSTRLPGKPLLMLAGAPIIWHTWQRARLSQAQNVVIATDDRRIYEQCKSFSAQVMMTSPDHQSGTDRIAEVAAYYHWDDATMVINVQGDEPFISPDLINQVAGALTNHPECGIATLAYPITDREDLQNPNVVKVVITKTGRALYFSRAPIPWLREPTPATTVPSPDYLRHIGIYGYRVSTLKRFITWSATGYEQLEALEQLRALWYDESIYVAIAQTVSEPGIDTPEDLERAQQMLSMHRHNP